MRNEIFSKKCNTKQLTNELKNSGFELYGVSGSENETIVHLKRTELKSATEIVEKHRPIEEMKKSIEERITEIEKILGL